MPENAIYMLYIYFFVIIIYLYRVKHSVNMFYNVAPFIGNPTDVLYMGGNSKITVIKTNCKGRHIKKREKYIHLVNVFVLHKHASQACETYITTRLHNIL